MTPEGGGNRNRGAVAPGGSDGIRTDGILREFRGAVSVSEVTQADLDRLDAGHLRRGLGNRPQPRRALSQEQLLQALCEWLHTSHHLNLIGTVTYSDEYLRSHRIYSLKAALDDVWAGLHECEVKGRRGYPWKFVLCGELHKSGRVHVHLALECPEYALEKVCADLWRYFYGTRGRARFEPMRDVQAATLYGLKDTVKGLDSASIRERLWHPKRRRSSRRSSSGGGGDPPRS